MDGYVKKKINIFQIQAYYTDIVLIQYFSLPPGGVTPGDSKKGV